MGFFYVDYMIIKTKIKYSVQIQKAFIMQQTTRVETKIKLEKAMLHHHNKTIDHYFNMNFKKCQKFIEIS